MAAFSSRGLRRLDDVMNRHVDRGVTPGLVYGLSRRGRRIVRAMGVTEPDGGTAVRRDAIFRVSSMTKPVTAVTAMALVEDGVLRLDDDVDRWLPELAGMRVLRNPGAALDDTVPARRPIRVRDLLAFTLGAGHVDAEPGSTPIQRALAEAGLEPGPPRPATMPDADTWLARLGRLPLVHQPGERWMYHTGSDVLGVLLSRASGTPLADLMHDRVLRPTGMPDTGFHVPDAARHRLGPCYWHVPGVTGLSVYDPADGEWAAPPAFHSGGAGLVSTASDFLRFGRMLLDGGVATRARRVLGRSSVELMTTDQLTPAQRRATPDGLFDVQGWGFGVAVVTRRTEVANVGSYGWHGGLGSTWSNDPREDLTLVLLTATAWSSPDPPGMTRDFWTAAYAALAD